MPSEEEAREGCRPCKTLKDVLLGVQGSRRAYRECVLSMRKNVYLEGDCMSEEATAESTAVQVHKPLSKSLKIFYGVGDFGFNLMSSVETYYFVFFLTNFAMFDPATAALISGIGSTVDAILGWMYGGFINSLKPMRWGRYRSWLLVLPWLVPILFCLEFTRFVENTALAAALIVFFNVTSHMAWDFPYVSNVSLIAIAGSNAQDRAHLASTRGMWSNASKIVFAYLIPPIASVGAMWFGKTNQYAFCAFVMGVIMAVLYYVHFRMFKGYEKEYTKEELANYKRDKNDAGRTTFKDLGRALVSNPPLIFLLLADIAKWVFNFMCAGIAAYYFTYAVFQPGMVATYIFISNILCVIGAYLSAPFARALKSTRNAMVFAFIFMAVVIFIARANYFNMWWVIIFMSLGQFGYGITYACSTAMYSDCVVYNEWKNKTNAAGWISGLQLFPLKIGFVARGIIIPLLLGAVGFVSASEFAPFVVGGARHEEMLGYIAQGQGIDELTNRYIEFMSGIGTGFMVVPAVLLIIGAVLLLVGYHLTPAKLAEYQKEIDARKAAALQA